jgi:hypothetical protein
MAVGTQPHAHKARPPVSRVPLLILCLQMSHNERLAAVQAKCGLTNEQVDVSFNPQLMHAIT